MDQRIAAFRHLSGFLDQLELLALQQRLCKERRFVQRATPRARIAFREWSTAARWREFVDRVRHSSSPNLGTKGVSVNRRPELFKKLGSTTIAEGLNAVYLRRRTGKLQ